MAGLQFPHAKDESSDLDYICDWSDWLGSDKIVSSVWDVPSGLQSTGDSFNDSVATIWIDEGEDGQTYVLINTIITLGARTAQRDIKLKVKNR